MKISLINFPRFTYDRRKVRTKIKYFSGMKESVKM